MRRFQQLLQGLDRTTGTSAKQHLLENYFRTAPAADAAWGLELLLGKRRRRLITGRRLRQVAQQLSGLPPWLFDDCHAQVGDSAETVALTLPAGDNKPLINAASMDGAQPARAGSTDNEHKTRRWQRSGMASAKRTFICSASCSVVAFASGSAAAWCKKRRRQRPAWSPPSPSA